MLQAVRKSMDGEMTSTGHSECPSADRPVRLRAQDEEIVFIE